MRFGFRLRSDRLLLDLLPELLRQLLLHELVRPEDESLRLLLGEELRVVHVDPEEARAIIDKVNVFVALTHTGETAVGLHGTDADVKSFFESIEVKQEGDRAVLNAGVPLGFLRKMLAESGPDGAEPSSPSPTLPVVRTTEGWTCSRSRRPGARGVQ